MNQLDFRDLNQPNNPSDFQRHLLTKLALTQKGRVEDYANIISELSPPPDITTIGQLGEFKTTKVGVIGGGLAGMATAFELRKLGFDITIFEAQEDRIGGRIYTYYFDRERTLYGEFGAMRMPVSHETLWHYINLFKLDTRPFIQNNENAFVYLKNIRVRNDPTGMNVMENIYPKYSMNPWERLTAWQQLVYYGFESPILEADPQIRSEILQVKACYNVFTLFWDWISNRKMLEKKGLSSGAIDLLKNFTPLAGQNLYNSFIDYVQELYSVDLSFLYEIPGGMIKLPLAFYNSLNSQYPQKQYPGIDPNSLGRVTWKRGSRVEGVYLNEDGSRVTLAFKNKNSFGRKLEQFDYVVCAVPFSTLRTIEIQPMFSNLKMQAIREVNYINAQKTLLLCNKRFWEEGGPGTQIIGGCSITDQPISQIYYPSDHAEHCVKNWVNIFKNNPSCNLHHENYKSKNLFKEPGVLLASYNFNLEAIRLSNMNDQDRFIEIKREVERVHGLSKGYLDSIAVGFKTLDWDSEEWFRGALCYYTPEQKRLFSYSVAAPEYDNKVFFAGEHVSGKHRWMQGSLKSGMDAANLLAMACKRRE